MITKDKLLRFLKGKKGNALLLSVAAAIAATFGTYFFVAITTLSQENKERITHLYNCYQMGLAVQAKIDGTDTTSARLTNTPGFTVNDLEGEVPDVFLNARFITLKEMIDSDIIAVGMDPTTGISYDHDNSGGLIAYADDSGVAIESADYATTIVREILLKTNLAGTNNVDATTEKGNPYDQGTPFYYVVMDSNGATDTNLNLSLTISSDNATILSSSPQAESSVILPSDFF